MFSMPGELGVEAGAELQDRRHRAPLSRTCPAVGFSTPETTFSKVLLPAPLRPTIPRRLGRHSRQGDVAQRPQLLVGREPFIQWMAYSLSDGIRCLASR